jgi:DNA-binding transcriptional regulator YhcF (GntR family)
LIISSLCAEKGYCFASNTYLAKLFDTNETTISRKLKILQDKGYIEIDYERRGTEVINRHIRLSKMITDRYQNWQPTVIKNDKENNISNNNTSINIKENTKRKTSSFSPPSLEEVENYIKEKNLLVNAKDFIQYFETGNWVDSKGQKVRNWKQKLLTWNKYRISTKTNKEEELRRKQEINREGFFKLINEEEVND